MNIPGGEELKAEQREAPPSPRSVLEVPFMGRADVRDSQENSADIRKFSTVRPRSDRAIESRVGSNRAQSTSDLVKNFSAVSWDAMILQQKNRRPINRPRRINTSS